MARNEGGVSFNAEGLARGEVAKTQETNGKQIPKSSYCATISLESEFID